MSFLFPSFLFALFAVAIPVIIHLFNFRRYKKVYFSNVKFLKNIQFQTSSGRQLKNILILLSRIFAIIFLVLAFSQPYIPAKNALKGFRNQVVSIFVDNSYSMETVNKEGTLLDEAKRRAKEIASTYSLNDKFQILTNDFEGKHQRLLNYEEFLTAIDEIKASSQNRSISQIISKQNDVFSAEPNSKKTIYIASDFQKNLFTDEAIITESTVTIRLIRLNANSSPNISIDSVWLTSPIHKAGQTGKIVIKLRNNSDQKADNIPIKLNLNSQQKAISSLSFEPRASKLDTLSFSGLTNGWQKGEISITDYPVIFDDKFYFTFNIERSLPLLIINGNTESAYLNALFNSDLFFKVNNVQSGNINYSGLNNYPLIILNEVKDISSGLIQQLKSYTKYGGSLLIFPSLHGDLSPLKSLLQSLGADIPEEIVVQNTKAASINLQHPIFKGVFERVPKNLDLPVVKKYIRYSLKSNTNRQSLLELPGRRGFFNDYKLGKGNLYLSAVPLIEEASNFARHSLFVPIMFQLSLLSQRNQRLFYTLGENQYLEIPKIALKANQTLKLHNQSFEAIPDVRQQENYTQLYIDDQIKQTGIYELLKSDSIISVLAFNDNRSESDLSYVDKTDLEGKFKNQKVEVFQPGEESMVNKLQSVNQGIQLWKVCLILSLLSLAIETLLIRFYNKKTSKLN